MKYQIKYLSATTKKVEIEKFLTWNDAVTWGKKNLNNFNFDLITAI